MCGFFFLFTLKQSAPDALMSTLLSSPPLPGALCRTLRTRRSSRGQEVSGEFQEVAAGGHDPGDRGCSGVTHRPEAPVRRDGRQHSAPTASFTTLSLHTWTLK